MVFLSAFIAGAINSVAGGGTLISFPALIWVGLPSTIANATSTVAIWPGSLGALWGYRGNLRGLPAATYLLIVPSLIGGIIGAVLLEMTPTAVFDRLVAVNVRAPLLLSQAAATIMRREGVDGSIVNVGSVTGYGGDVFLLPYAVSKGALHALTRNTAFALMRDRIRVNLLNLGWMDTPAEDVIQRRYHGAGDGWLERAAERQPFGRLIDPVEVGRMICFLLSEESGLMTGAVLDFDQSVLGAGASSKPTEADVWPETRKSPDGET